MGQLTTREDTQTLPMILELVPGWFQFFGIGHIYQGRVGMGVFIMASYWGLQVINFFLSFVGIGLITAPLTWLFYMVASAHNAKTWDGRS